MQTRWQRLYGFAVVAVVSLAWLVGAPGGTAAEELRIGFLAPMTGIFAQIGKDMSHGFKMYLDEVGSDFAGAQVTFILEDGQGKPPVNVRKAQKLIRQDRVHLLIGDMMMRCYAARPTPATVGRTKLRCIPITRRTAGSICPTVIAARTATKSAGRPAGR